MGVHGQRCKRNAPTLFNRGFAPVQMWDGRVDTLEEQVLMPIVAENEEDAAALFRAAAQPGVLRVDRTIEAEVFGKVLVEAGLVGHEVSDEMVRGDWPGTRHPARVFAMASHAWG